MSRTFNFSAGPATLPLPVLETIQKEFLDYQGTGMSLMEMSHRGSVFKSVYAESVERLRKLASIPDNFDILYMTGGASTQFALIPLNLGTPGGTVGYINTGAWSKKAIAQAKFCDVKSHICATSDETNHNFIPKELDVPAGLDYVHMTSNNTIFGTQFASLPAVNGSKLVIDMSSDFLAYPIDWTNIGMAYAGTQKNAGPSGLTVVVIDKAYYDREKDSTPDIMRYSTFAKNDSMYNTPPTFQIYTFNLVMKWLEENGGLTGIQKHNQEKGKIVYDAIDNSDGFYIGHAEKDSRSLMNITFNLKDRDRTDEFLKGAEERKLSGLKGHRSVGGLRASTYNAMSKEGCQTLATYMNEFKNG